MVMCLTGLRGEDVKPRSSQGLGARGLALHLRTGGRVPHIPGVEHWPSLPCPGSYAFDTVCQGRGLRQERTAWMAWRSAGGKVSCLPQVETCPGPRPAGEMQGLRWQALSEARAPPPWQHWDSTGASPSHCSSPDLCGGRSGPCSLEAALESLPGPGSSEPSNMGQLL